MSRSRRQQLKIEKLKANQYISLVVYDPDQGKLNLHSRILEIQDSSLLLKWPVDAQYQKYFFKGVNFSILQAIVEEEVLAVKVPIRIEKEMPPGDHPLCVDLPDIVDTMEQKRVYERVARNVDVKFRAVSGDGFSNEDFEGSTNDLSVGGMELSCFEELAIDSLVELSFTMEYFDFHGIQAKVIRKRESTENGNLEYVYNLRFLGMLERERTTLNHVLLRYQAQLPTPQLVLDDNQHV